MNLRKISTTLLVSCGLILCQKSTSAQNLDSSSYTLIAPTIGNTVAGGIESTNFSQILSPGTLDGFTSTSDNYSTTGGFSRLVEASIPIIQCFETDSASGNSDCTGLPGSDGMQAVCAIPGCFDRAKLEIDVQTNPADTRYAIQISTTSNFSSNVFYVDGTTRFLKTNLTLDDFIPKCEWEGTTSAGVCASANTTWQRYNILGLLPNTTYYVRASAHSGGDSGNFTQTNWGPAANATTTIPTLAFDIDIAPNTSTATNPPYTVDLGLTPPNNVTSSSDYIVFKTSTNLLGGAESQVKSLNAALQHNSLPSTISSVTGDLAVLTSGYGIRNVSSTNGSQNSGTIGSIVVSTTPNDFSDSGPAHRVGQTPSNYVRLFSTNNLPLDSGTSGYVVKVKPDTGTAAGTYTDILTFILLATI